MFSARHARAHPATALFLQSNRTFVNKLRALFILYELVKDCRTLTVVVLFCNGLFSDSLIVYVGIEKGPLPYGRGSDAGRSARRSRF
jgi:hypothetical protein